MEKPRVQQDDYCDEDLPRLTQPWWQTLPSRFHALPDHFLMDPDVRLRVDTTAAADTVIRTGLACLAGAAALPTVLSRKQKRLERDVIDFYLDFLHEDDGNVFFAPPKRGVHMETLPVSRYHFHPEKGSAHTLRFPSPFQARHPALRKRYASHQRNRIAWAQHWRHDGPPRATLVLIHGFVADPYWLNTRWLALPWFFKQGFDVLLYTLPFHGHRKGRFAPFSGSQFFSQGMAMLNETFAHAIHDLRLFMNYLREQGSPAIGATGISLGGYTTGLLAALEDELAFAIPNVPLVSIMDLMKSWFPINHNLRLLENVYDTDLKGLRKITALHSPLTWPCRVPRAQRMIIGGVGDRFAPPKHAHLLWQHWNHCDLHWFPGNHLLHLDQGLYLKAMRDFMKRALATKSVSLAK